MREKRGDVATMQKSAQGKLKMYESPTECGRAHNYELVKL